MRRLGTVISFASAFGTVALLHALVMPPALADGDFATGLQRPAKILRTPLGNLLVAEVGTASSPANSGRVSIVNSQGVRRTLIEGLPSAPTNAANTPSGPSGLYLQGRTLFIAIGEGNPTLPGPIPRTEIPNPSPASPIFSSVLAVHFSSDVENSTSGIALTLNDHLALKSGARIVRQDSNGRRITINLVVDFPDYIPEPLPALASNVRHSHPYGVVANDCFLYVVDSGYNLVHLVEQASGNSVTLTSFPNSQNPLFGVIGPPQFENVPTSIRWDGDQLLVTIFSGFPFPAGTSRVLAIHPVTGESAVLIAGLTSAIDVVPLKNNGNHFGYLTLEFSTNQLAGALGRLQAFSPAGAPVAVLNTSLVTPGSLAVDTKSGDIFVTELILNRVLGIHSP